jgi:hypothetical protein
MVYRTTTLIATMSAYAATQRSQLPRPSKTVGQPWNLDRLQWHLFGFGGQNWDEQPDFQ